MMRKLVLFLLTWTAFLAGNLSAQKIEWSRLYGGDRSSQFYSITATEDGGYAAAGKTYTSSINAWNAWVVRTDSIGNQMWEYFHASELTSYFYEVVGISTGGFIATGYSETRAGGDNGAFVTRFDDDGNVVWARTYSVEYRDKGVGFSVIEAADGGFVVAGIGNLASTNWWEMNAQVFKIDNDGNVEWAVVISDSVGTQARSISRIADGGYIVTGKGYTDPGGDQLLLARLDAAGNIIWLRDFGGRDSDWGYSVCQTWDGRFLVVGYMHIDLRYGLLCTNSDGDSLWVRQFSGPISSISSTADSGHICSGENHLIRFGLDGNELWEERDLYSQMSGLSQGAGISAVIPSVDGGYVFAGQGVIMLEDKRRGLLGKVIVPPVAVATYDINWIDDDNDGYASGILQGDSSYHFESTPLTSFVWEKGGTIVGTDTVLAVDLPTGTHYYSLLVTDANGNSDTAEVWVNVHAQRIATEGAIKFHR
jgi:hypothetical protein